MSRLWVLVVIAIILVTQFATNPQHGFRANCVKGQCYVVAAASQVGVIVSAVLAAFLVLYPQARPELEHAEPV